MDSFCHPGFTTTKLSYRFPIFETSATALCGTTGITSNHIMNTYSCVYIHIFTPPLKRLHLSPPLRHRQAPVPVAWRDAPGSYAPARRRSPVAAPKGPRSWLRWPRCVPANEAGKPLGIGGALGGTGAQPPDVGYCWLLLVDIGIYNDIYIGWIWMWDLFNLGDLGGQKRWWKSWTFLGTSKWKRLKQGQQGVRNQLALASAS